ncbi:hypothetical protein [Mycolicibacterium fluoranthenivorans]|uniref:Uncharacterized protein n=1 Tax=Mycolicibacterium fluoranthenivorans TaxID=258505 RepID=A0A7X5U1J8_9MYCO|nr:hypothetical protein [Mycolicibacterium fluoranthenivorans]MCV7359739.1 hypothetical protein [Mycolicibacterium fluoranthenivorans]NIH96712.1 hypothetical protein [Mycolicibacterium fluoranthenivorans]
MQRWAQRTVMVATAAPAAVAIGTATGDGYPEHSFNWDFNWDVVQRVRAGLEQAGAHTVAGYLRSMSTTG